MKEYGVPKGAPRKGSTAQKREPVCGDVFFQGKAKEDPMMPVPMERPSWMPPALKAPDERERTPAEERESWYGKEKMPDSLRRDRNRLIPYR